MPKKKNQPKPPTEKIDFPAEDQGWIALQQRVIELAGKPVEDLEWDGVEKISRQLAPPEQETLRKYWFRLKQEQEKSSPAPSPSKPTTGIPKWKNWEDQICNKTFEWMIDFHGYLRVIVVRLEGICHRQETNSYSDVLEAMKKGLIDWLPSDALSEGSDIIGFLVCNLGNIFPTDEGYELLRGFYKQLDAREGELKKERAMAIPASAVPSAPTGTPSPKLESKPEPKEEERMTLAEAFELGDDKDDERAVRAAALLLDWASEVGNTRVDGMLVMGVSRVLYLAAEQIARTARKVERERLESR